VDRVKARSSKAAAALAGAGEEPAARQQIKRARVEEKRVAANGKRGREEGTGRTRRRSKAGPEEGGLVRARSKRRHRIT
jgi:hypothetical protein